MDRNLGGMVFMEGTVDADGIKSGCHPEWHLNSVSGIRVASFKDHQGTLKASQSPLAGMVFIERNLSTGYDKNGCYS